MYYIVDCKYNKILKSGSKSQIEKEYYLTYEKKQEYDDSFITPYSKSGARFICVEGNKIPKLIETKHFDNLKAIREQLFDAPAEVKESFNQLVKFFEKSSKGYEIWKSTVVGTYVSIYDLNHNLLIKGKVKDYVNSTDEVLKKDPRLKLSTIGSPNEHSSWLKVNNEWYPDKTCIIEAFDYWNLIK